MAIDRSIRRSQTVSPFGAGGVYDIGAESFVAMDTTKWKVGGDPDIRLPRLEKLLRVDGFRSAPIAGEASFPGAIRAGQPIPYYRFPTWLFCPRCRSMIKWKLGMEEKGKPPRCANCAKKVNLVPMRFMAVCKAGHLMDVPWGRWAHFGSDKTEAQRRCRDHVLEFISDPNRGAGLQSLVVRCRKCAARNDLERLPHKDSLKPIFKCSGTHPWQSPDQAPACDQVPQVVQRGASNAYYPMVVSAIDIRAGSNSGNDLIETIKAHAKWPLVSGVYSMFDEHDSSSVKTMIQKSVDQMLSDGALINLGVTSDTIWKILQGSESGEGKEFGVDAYSDDLLLDEWKAFIEPPAPERNADFIAEIVDLESFGCDLAVHEMAAWKEFRKLIAQVTLARKLRVVRALKGFNRLEPELERLTPPTLGVRPGWLPATEIFGEGIFIALDLEELNAWEARLPPEHLKVMKKNRNLSSLGFLPEISPRFVLLHTLSHLLMRQLCFECGYSSSSLTERLYCDPAENMAGLLIYTASADSEGALGGLVREGLPDRLYGTFKSALFRATWCSNDPICSEMPQQGVQGLNKAACHACTLVAETSCDHANSLLDRSVVLGTFDKPSIGYFRKFAEKIGESLA